LEYWNLNEVAGSSRTGSANSIALIETGGNVVDNPGRIGSGRAVETQLSGTPYLAAPWETPGLDVGGSDFTLGFWFYVETTWPRLNRAMLGQVSAGPTLGVFDVFLQGSNVGAESVVFQLFDGAGTSGAGSLIASVGAPRTDVWIMAIAKFVSGTSFNLRVSTTSAFGALQTIGTALTTPTNQGEFHIGRDGGGFDDVDCRIDGVGFWNRSITAAEEQCWWNLGLGLHHPF
jgi:hypothetical protein